MPARSSHLPHYSERAALLKLRGGKQLPLLSLHPAGKATVKKMVGKGWIEGPLEGVTYRITSAGEAALSAELPIRIMTSKFATPTAATPMGKKDRTKLRRFFETLPSGSRTNRLAYVTSMAAMPDAAEGTEWKEDETFNAAEAILQNPGLKEVYTTAIEDGCAIDHTL